MSTIDLTRADRDRARRPRRAAVAGTVLVAGTLVLALTDRGGSAGGGSLGPTAEAAPRDLATTLEASGSLQRSSEQVVAHAGAVTSDSGATVPDDGAVADGEAEGGPMFLTAPAATSRWSSSGPSSSGASSGSTSAPSSGTGSATSTTAPATPPSSSTSSSTSSTTSTTGPCPPSGSTPTSSSTSSSSTTSSTTCPSSSTTTSTTAPPGTTPTTRPPGGDGSTGESGGPTGSTAKEGGGPLAREGDTGDGRVGASDGAAGPADRGTGGDGDSEAEADGAPPAVLTGLLDVGATAGRGTVLYTADEQPVVALVGDLPAWRTLREGVDDGADVHQLEENLAALGYGAGLAVDETFTADTAAAVEAWETDLGREAPDGEVAVGDVVFLAAPGDVLRHEAAVGDALQAGTPVVSVGSEQRIVVAEVSATEAAGWAPGSTVELEWADSTTTAGTVFGTGRDVTDGRVELVVALGPDADADADADAGAGGRRSGAEADVTLVDARREGAVAVPVAAIVDDGGTPAVRVVASDGDEGDGGGDLATPVETGLVADGWVEITAGLDGGERVRLPG